MDGANLIIGFDHGGEQGSVARRNPAFGIFAARLVLLRCKWIPKSQIGTEFSLTSSSRTA